MAGNLVKKALMKDVAPGLSNIYTGKALRSSTAVAGIAAGTAGTIGLMGGFGPQKYQTTSNQVATSANSILGDGSLAASMRMPAEQAVSPSIMAGATMAPPQTSNAPDLGATGDLVFGMHNMR